MILVARFISGKYERVKDSCSCVVKKSKILTYTPRLMMHLSQYLNQRKYEYSGMSLRFKLNTRHNVYPTQIYSV